jgi:hypothetical protein
MNVTGNRAVRLDTLSREPHLPCSGAKAKPQMAPLAGRRP